MPGLPLFAQGIQNDDAAYSEGQYGGERDDEYGPFIEVKDVGEQGADGADDAKRIEPQRTSSGGGSNSRKIRTQAQLQKQRGHADGRDHD